MPFKKGISGNYKGRPKGSRNKVDAQVKKSFEDLLHYNLKDLQEDLNNMDKKDKWNVLMRISDKVLPNLKSVESQVSVEANKPEWIDDLKDLSDHQVDLILNANNDEDEQ